jgi:hypothetical protein
MGTYVGGRVSEIISADDIMLLMIGVAQVLLGSLLNLVSKVTKLYEIATYISDILTSLINQSANVIPIHTLVLIISIVIAILQIGGLVLITFVIKNIIYKLWRAIRSY